jgi:hypothetical protein
MDAVILRDKSSGRFHRAAQDDHGQLLSHEADNLDSSGAFEVVEQLPPDVDNDLLCKRCFMEADA